MRLMESAVAAGLVIIGTIVLGAGYLISVKIIAVGGIDTTAFSEQLMDAGFVLVAAGFISWIVMYSLKELGII